MPSRPRCHLYLNFDELARLLKAPGVPIRAWVEDDQDWIHLLLEWDGPLPLELDGFHDTAPGAFTEGKHALHGRDTIVDELARARQALAHYRDNGTLCPCGARPEAPDTHPHVISCPVGIAEEDARPTPDP